MATLSATIKDITAETGDGATDNLEGDIRKATVTFINRDNNTEIATVPVRLVAAGDTKVGMGTYNWMELIDKGEPGNADTIGINVWNNDGGVMFSSNWDGTHTVEQILGGGNLVVR
jgi:hypothetical protein